MALVISMISAAAGGAFWWLSDTTGYRPTLIEKAAGPGLSVPAVASSFIGSELAGESGFDPSLGIAVTDSSGTIYTHDGMYWSAITPGGDSWISTDALATISESEGRISLGDVPQEDRGWIEAVLDLTRSIHRDGEIYVIDDSREYRDGIVRAATGRGVVVNTEDPTSTVLMRRSPAPLVWTVTRDGHIWLIDDTAAVLVLVLTETKIRDGVVVAGRLVPDTVHGAVWQPAPNTDGLSESVSAAFADFDNSIIEDGLRKVPFKILVAGEPPPIRVDKIPGSNVEVAARVYKVTTQNCGTFSMCTIQSLGSAASSGISSAGSEIASGFRSGWNTTVNKTDQFLDSVPLEAVSCVAATLVCQVDVGQKIAENAIEGAKTVAELAKIVWQNNGNVFAEKKCDVPGPEPAGGKAAREFPSTGYNLDNVVTLNTTDWPERLRLARDWIPLLEPSKDEQCGEIIRVFAQVHPYTPQGGKANSLADAARIEITYTVFYREDGGRFEILGKGHPGDNEGFVIGLVRTSEQTGLCSTGFKFAGGRAVSHSNKGGAIVEYTEINRRQIDDFGPADVGTECPQRGDPKWRLLASEGKHATYYHRDASQTPREGRPFPDSSSDPNGTNCEAALGPRLPLALAAAATFAASGAGAPLSILAGLTADALAKYAPGKSKDWLYDGLEECESGRPPIDLSDRVELYDMVLNGSAGSLGFDREFETEDGPEAYAEKVRGRWCFGSFTPNAVVTRPSCNDPISGDPWDFHVPGLFDARFPTPTADNAVVDLAPPDPAPTDPEPPTPPDPEPPAPPDPEPPTPPDPPPPDPAPPTNLPPVAVSDVGSYDSGYDGMVIHFNVLANDYDPEGAAIAFAGRPSCISNCAFVSAGSEVYRGSTDVEFAIEFTPDRMGQTITVGIGYTITDGDLQTDGTLSFDFVAIP